MPLAAAGTTKADSAIPQTSPTSLATFRDPTCRANECGADELFAQPLDIAKRYRSAKAAEFCAHTPASRDTCRADFRVPALQNKRVLHHRREVTRENPNANGDQR